MGSLNDDDLDYLEQLHKHYEETVRLLSDKKWCEKTLCGEFLSRIGMQFEEEEIIVVEPLKEPPDIEFRSAKFEIMYIVGERKPDKEAKDRLKELIEAKTIDDTLSFILLPEKVTFDYLAGMISNSLNKKRKRYDPKIIPNLDALVYVRLNQFPDISSLLPSNLSQIISQGWRSVSTVISEYSLVLYANSTAPGFLKEIEGKQIPKTLLGWWYPKK
jgi:hypothetical protein